MSSSGWNSNNSRTRQRIKNGFRQYRCRHDIEIDILETIASQNGVTKSRVMLGNGVTTESFKHVFQNLLDKQYIEFDKDRKRSVTPERKNLPKKFLYITPKGLQFLYEASRIIYRD